MKYVVLVCEGMTDEPSEAFGGRTPLELAKAPNLQRLAKNGIVGSAVFTPPKLGVSPDVAAMAILGYDPEEFYTGIAPLEALAMGIVQADNEIAFRCDLVTIADEVLVDVGASFISLKESSFLIKDLNRKLSTAQVRLYPGEGYKNILMIHDPEKAEGLDELECIPPARVVGQRFRKFLPKGEGAALVTEFMEKSRAVLEDHEINRVRIDLKENPANMVWPWGQGRRPKLPAFKERCALTGAVYSETEYAQGLGLAAGLVASQDLVSAVRRKDFVFVHVSAGAVPPAGDPFKSRIRLVEYFDAQIVGNVLKELEGLGEHRMLVCSDIAGSSLKGTVSREPVPFLIEGQGFETQGAPTGFNEKSAMRGRLSFSEGCRLMESFLK